MGPTFVHTENELVREKKLMSDKKWPSQDRTPCDVIVLQGWSSLNKAVVPVSEGSPFSWWLSGPGPGRLQSYWGGAQPGSQQCACGLQGVCVDPQHYCNCDADRVEWYWPLYNTDMLFTAGYQWNITASLHLCMPLFWRAHWCLKGERRYFALWVPFLVV